MATVLAAVMGASMLVGCGNTETANNANNVPSTESNAPAEETASASGELMTYEKAQQLNEEKFGVYGTDYTDADLVNIREGYINMENPDETDEDVNYYSIVHYVTLADGTKIYGELGVPLDFDPASLENGTFDKEYPLMIMSHGFLVDADSYRHAGTPNYIIPLGYVTYAFDFPGGAAGGPEVPTYGCRSDGEFTEMSVVTEKEDLNALIDVMKEEAYVNSDEIVLMGQSQGGLVTAMAMSEREREGNDDIAGAILLYPAFSIVDDMHNFFATYDDIEAAVEGGTVSIMGGNVGTVYATDVYNMDLMDEIDDYTGNVLILHGTADTTVSCEYSVKAVQEAYAESQSSCILLTGAAHSFDMSDSTPEKVNDMAEDYIVAYLRANNLIFNDAE